MNKNRTHKAFIFVDLLLVMVIVFLGVLIVWVNYKTLAIRIEAQQSLGELRQIQAALIAYRKETGQYPLSTTCLNTFGGGGAWQGSRSHYGGDCESACWIPQLSELGRCPLPRERTQQFPGFREYLYRSDGNDYKLIYHGAPSVAVGKSFLDPVRPSYAYGFWTEGAVQW